MTATRPELPASATLAHPASDEHAESGPARPRARLRGLDGLRFFAAFAVLLYHFGAFDTYSDAVWGESVEEATGPVGVWFGYGALAPSLFFVISGFVILMSAQGRGGCAGSSPPGPPGSTRPTGWRCWPPRCCCCCCGTPAGLPARGR
ncbi:acyltransferase family protein [Sanguibacter sp. Z1732]|uniref:acyltransferase family protein n=1 Tax=Sanguibacter sp. Z1732 TaxID=3435412 RepID=UPI003D9C8885